MLGKLRTRLSNLAARAVVRVVNNKSGMQLVQLDDLPGGPFDGAEHFQPAHLSWTPADGSLAVAIFPNGDMARPLVVATADPRDRPTDGIAGEFTIYHRDGARITLKNGGDITVDAAPGGKVYLSDGSGGTEALAKVSELQALRNALANHQHAYVLPLHPSGLGGVTTGGPALPTATGTQKVEGA